MIGGSNITKLSEQISSQLIPNGKTGHSARYDKEARRTLEAALSVVFRDLLKSRMEIRRTLKLARHPTDKSRAETYQNLDTFDQLQVMHRINQALKYAKPQTESIAE